MAPDLRCNQHNHDQIPDDDDDDDALAGPVHTSGRIQPTHRPRRSDGADSSSGFNTLIMIDPLLHVRKPEKK